MTALIQLGRARALLRSTLCLIVAFLLYPAAGAFAHTEFRLGFWVNTYSLSAQIGGDNITSIAQTSDGYLWIGTQLGLFRFDGDRFVPAADLLPMQRLPVATLFASSTALYVATSGRGFFRIEGQTVTHFDTTAGLADNVVWEFAEYAPDRLRIATSNGVSELQGDVLRTVAGIDGMVSHLASDEKGNTIYISGTGTPYRVMRGTSTPQVMNANKAYALFKDSKERFWLGTDQGLSVAADARAALVEVPELVGQPVVALAETGAGDLWAATNTGEMWQLTQTGWAHRHLATRIPNSFVNVMVVDALESLWIGTRKGLAQVSGGAVVELGPTLGGPDVWAVTRDIDGNVWMASGGGGINQVDVDALALIPLQLELPSKEIWALAPSPNGGLWVGSGDAGAFLIRDGRIVRSVNELPVPQVWSVLEKSDGTLFIGTDGGGLVRIDDGGRQIFNAASGLAGDRVWALHEAPNNALWIGTNHGLCVLRDDKLDCYDKADGLPGNAVWSIKADKADGLWVSTDRGLAHVDAGRRIRASRREPLSSANVFGVEYDTRGDLWAISAQGLHRIRRQQISNLFDEHATSTPLGRTFGPADGLNQTLTSGASPPITLDEKGGLWLATEGGLALIETNALRDDPIPLTLRVESLSADGTRYRADNGSIQLPPGTRTLSVSYTALAFRHPNEARIEYRLRGVTEQWSAATLDRELVFSNPPAGDYRLEIRLAANSLGLVSPRTGVDFSVAPYWHQRPSVRVAGLVLLALLLGGLYQLRVRQVMAQHKEREAATRRELKTTRALAESESHIQDIFANINDLLFSAGHTNTIIEANPAAQRLLPNCEIGQPLHRVLSPEAIEESAHKPWQWKIQTLDGRKRTLDLRSARGSNRSLLFVARDVSDEVLLQEQVAAAARIESIGQLTAGVAHDFNNLLTVIQGNASMLAERLDDDASAPMAKAIVEASECAADITSKLLSIGRRQTIIPQRLALNGQIRDMQSILEGTLENKVNLSFDLTGDLFVDVDSGLLQQIVLNLVINARDAIVGAGVITVHTQEVHVDDAFAARNSGVQPGRHALMRVSDTGEGMDQQTLERVFEPFFSTKAAGVGAGLGMATVYGAVMQCAGAIEINSEIGKGTHIDVFLPLSAEISDAATPAVRALTQGRNESILVVDDDRQILALIRNSLESHGYNVATAESVDKALKMHESKYFDLLLSDVVIGEDSGPRLLARLRELGAQFPALFISGYAHAHRQELVDSDVKLLRKPFNGAQLLAFVRRELDRERSQRANPDS